MNLIPAWFDVSPTPVQVLVECSAPSDTLHDHIIEAVENGNVVAQLTFTVIQSPRIQFDGRFQCRLSTDPDGFDNPWGQNSSFGLYAVMGPDANNPVEPPLDRIVRFHDPVALRKHAPPVGVFVRRVQGLLRDGTQVSFSAGDAVIGQPVFIGPECKFDNLIRKTNMPKPTLQWRTYELSASGARALKRLTQSAHLMSAPLSFEAAALEAIPGRLDLPELPNAPEQKAALLLKIAAQIEHALMVQYLYASFSFANGSSQLAGVAIEEMSHFMTVQNLLRLIGEQPHLQRQDFGAVAADDERLFPFELLLEPLSHVSLAKYVVAESPEVLPPSVNPSVMARIVDVATQGAQGPVNRVGTLYTLMGVVFGCEQLLLELAATQDPWYVAVYNLANEAAVFYGGRDKLHLPDSSFQPDTEALQGTEHDWDRSKLKAHDEFRIHVVRDRRSALDALRDIGLQGEGPTSIETEIPHFKRFYDLFLEFFGPDGMGTNVPPGVLDVPLGSQITVNPGGSGAHVIAHAETAKWANLADVRYALLLGALDLYCNATSEERQFLRGWCFAEMHTVNKLAQFLRRMPRAESGEPKVGAVPFNLPPWLSRPATWSDMISEFEKSLALVSDIQTSAGINDVQRSTLFHLHSGDQRKLAEAQARNNGSTVRTRTDQVRDILDWAAGAGDPSHLGDSPALGFGAQGRFWNLPHSEFIQVAVFGNKVVQPPAPGSDAPLIAQLRTSMPRQRPKLDPAGEEFKLVEEWTKDGAPNDPL